MGDNSNRTLYISPMSDKCIYKISAGKTVTNKLILQKMKKMKKWTEATIATTDDNDENHCFYCLSS